MSGRVERHERRVRRRNSRDVTPVKGWRRWHARCALGLLRAMAVIARRYPTLKLPRWVPLAGDIDGRMWAAPVELNDKKFGRSMTIPAVLEIHVDGREGGRTSPLILHPVATRIFGGYEPFIFNVSFACGRALPLTPGVYNDPGSPWFNVFAGYYEIDVSQAAWGRPFGYAEDRSEGGFRLQEGLEDLSRLGAADWNYFSNYMYGVPLEAIFAIDQHETRLTAGPRQEIAGQMWDHVIGDAVDVVSAFTSTGTRLEDNDYLLNDLWQCAFGLPYTASEPRTSYFPTSMHAELYVCYDAAAGDRDLREPVYRTFVFGGTVNNWWAEQLDASDRSRYNAEFLDFQMHTIRSLIADRFAHLGFATT